MLSIHGMGLAGEESGLYYTSLAREDYYTKGGEPSGQWHGKAAEHLGLSGSSLQADELKNLLYGFDASGQNALVQGAGQPHYAGWDLTLNAPKSVSVLWAMTDDPAVRAELQAAQQAAVEATVAFVERHCAWTRRGHDGTEQERVAGLIVATFEHGTSREQDPHLHTHLLVANTALRQDGTYGALDGRHFYAWKMATGAVYRAELNAQINRRFPDLQTGRDGTSFAVRGIPENVVAHYSKRTDQIAEWMKDQGYSGSKMAQLATLDTRRTKDMIDRPALFGRWQQEGRALGWGPEQAAALLARAPQQQPTREAPALEAIREGLVQQESTFTEPQAWRAMAENMQGVGGVGAIEERMVKFWNDPSVVERGRDPKGRTHWSTEAMVQLEAKTIASAMDGSHRAGFAVDSASVDRAIKTEPRLNEGQIKAIRHLCEHSGHVATVEGWAGTGKSTMLDVARQAWEASGYKVIGAAPSAVAALGLQKSAHFECRTIHSSLGQWAKKPELLDEKTIVVIDEAGMVDSRLMARITQATQATGAKLVLIGDHTQLQPIQAGGIFRAITERVETPKMTDIIRQKEGWARAAVKNLSGGRVGEALQAYEERGLTHVGDNKAETVKALVADWVKARERDPDERLLMLAGQRADVKILNQEARNYLRAQGRLGPDQRVITANGARLFAVGDRVVCGENHYRLGLRNGQAGSIEQISAGKTDVMLRLRLDGSPQPVEVSLKAYNKIDHGYAMTVHKSQSVTVDRTFVLAGGSMASREIGVVSLSRHAESARIYVDRSLYPDRETEKAARNVKKGEQRATPQQSIQDQSTPATPDDGAARVRKAMQGLTRQLEISQQKDTTLDYRPAERSPEQGQSLE